MGNQKKFAPGVIARIQEKIRKEDPSYSKAYLDKKQFSISFNSDDFEFCDLPAIPSALGQKMQSTFLENLNPNKKNDFRKADFECGRLLYETLKLTPRQASDIDFWSYLHHYDFYNYIHKRWSDIHNLEGNKLADYIQRRWLMTLSSQKHLITFPLTSLWWSIHLTIDEDREDPYELTKIYFNNNRYRTVTFGGSSYVRHKEAILGVLEFYKKHNIPETKENGDNISKFVNLLGGTKPLGFFKREWFVKNLEKKFINLTNKDKQTSGKDFVYINQGTLFEGIQNEEAGLIKQLHTTNRNNSNKVADKVLRYFSLFNNGEYFLKNKPMNEADYNIPIYEGQEKGFLLQCYDNGRVNKVPLTVLLDKTLNRELPYKNGLFKDQSILKIQCIKEDCLLLITMKNLKNECIGKIHKTEWISTHNQLHLMGNEITKNIVSLGYTAFSGKFEKELSKLIKKSTSAVIPINNTYYKKEWNLVKTVKPVLCK